MFFATLEQDEDCIILFLLREWLRFTDQNSKHKTDWDPYLKVLPKVIPVASSFSDQMIRELQSERYVAMAKRSYVLFQSFLIASYCCL